ncbi:oligosaccharide flippase family protein [Patescibacteria group bacterium]|nr:oligosaccharide flippase family protein [Patescibacteria group bacterium]
MKRIVDKISAFAAHPVARSSAIVLFGTTMANAGAYAYHLVVGRILGPEQYGELGSLLSLLYLLNVPSLVLQIVLTRYIAGFRANNELGRAKTLSISFMRRLSLLLFVGVLIIVPLTGVIAEFLHIAHPVSVFYIYLTAALWLLGIVQASLLQGLQRFVPAMVISNIAAVLRLVGGVIGATFGVVETVLAGVITSIMTFISYFFPLRFVYKAQAQPTNITRKEVVAYTIPSLLSMLAITSLYSMDIILVKHYLPPFEAGLYAALSVMGKIIYFASSSVSYVLFPVVAERKQQNAGSERLVYSGLAAIGFVSASITAGYFLFPEFALFLLFGESYYPAAPYLGWLGVFLSLYSLNYILVTILLGLGNARAWMLVGVAAVLQVVGIIMYHRDIVSILTVNIVVMIGLLLSLIVYYRHAVTKH